MYLLESKFSMTLPTENTHSPTLKGTSLYNWSPVVLDPIQSKKKICCYLFEVNNAAKSNPIKLETDAVQWYSSYIEFPMDLTYVMALRKIGW